LKRDPHFSVAAYKKGSLSPVLKGKNLIFKKMVHAARGQEVIGRRKNILSTDIPEFFLSVTVQYIGNVGKKQFLWDNFDDRPDFLAGGRMRKVGWQHWASHVSKVFQPRTQTNCNSISFNFGKSLSL
jgi:hypothetical protein